MGATKKQLLKTVASRVTKGGVKSIPFVGGILEEAIFGVMDAESARKESAKVQRALHSLQGSVGAQAQTLEALITLARDEAELNHEARQAIDQILATMSSADADEEVAEVLDRVVTRHGIDLSALSGDADAFERELAKELRPEVVTRASLIGKLSETSHADIDALVATLGAYGIPDKSSNRKSRAAKLVEWAQRPDGEGIAEVVFVARELDLKGFQKAIPDPR